MLIGLGIYSMRTWIQIPAILLPNCRTPSALTCGRGGRASLEVQEGEVGSSPVGCFIAAEMEVRIRTMGHPAEHGGPVSWGTCPTGFLPYGYLPQGYLPQGCVPAPKSSCLTTTCPMGLLPNDCLRATARVQVGLQGASFQSAPTLTISLGSWPFPMA